MGETGAKESEGLFNAACSFNYTCYSLFCVFFYVGILRACVSSTWDASTRAAEQTKVLLFFPPPDLLYPVDIVL